MNILQTITAVKKLEVAERKKVQPVEFLENSRLFERIPKSLTRSLMKPDSSGVIAEFKRKSPSRGWINRSAAVESVVPGYDGAGAAGLSVLTDPDFFGGTSEDLSRARGLTDLPVLRKEFIIDPYQVIEAKSIGADAILLIAAILTPAETLELAKLARSLGLETLLEVHTAAELEHRNEYINMIGVNNRNLADFTVSIDVSLSLSGLIGNDFITISESGIREPSDILMLRQAGFRGFLVGEQFMATDDPAGACAKFISGLIKLNL